MNLWLISQTDRTKHETHDSAVVAANSEEEARLVPIPVWRSPEDHTVQCWHEKPADFGLECWSPSVRNTKVKYLGPAAPDIQEGLVLAGT